VEQFPIFINAFITEEVAEQRAQFILVNSTKPLPKGLIHELLPSTEAPLPLALHKKRLPALLLERLNYDGDSPLRGRIRTPTSGGGTIKDNSILKMLENSISDGALYNYRYTDHGRPDLD
jgi:DGQHR domain-containing protein